MKVESIQDLFVSELRDLYSAEKQAVRMYPKLIKAASAQELKDALQTHAEQTKGQVARLEEVFGQLEKKPGGKTCEGMKGVLAEGTEAIDEIEKGAVRDAALIASAQRAEHYEIAAYGSAVAFAKILGESEILSLLNETLNEEKETDKKLTVVSKGVNKKAKADSDEGMEPDDEPLPDEDDDQIQQ